MRETVITVPCSLEQKAIMRQEAQRRGMALSTWLRYLGLQEVHNRPEAMREQPAGYGDERR